MTTTRVQSINEAQDPVVRKGLALNPPQKGLIMGGVIVAFILAVYLLATQHVSQTMLLVIGLMLGYTLFHARFGFTSAFRRMMSVGNGQAMRSHMLMLAVAVSLFAPILAYGSTFFGGPVAGYVSPVGISLIVGAYFGGIASFSLHGYIWGILALAGTFLALYLRPLFGLSVPKSNDSVC